MTIKEALSWGIEELKKDDVSEVESSAVLLLANVINKDKSYIYSHNEEKLSSVQDKIYRKFISRRKSHEPVWYTIGEVEFYGRKFKVSNDVMTPRPETELLIQEILKNIKGDEKIVELGTGSGAISITLSKELNKKIVATDISEEALKVARKNEKGLKADVDFDQSDLLENIKNTPDVIVANLPYIPSEDMESLQFDVLHHEPRIALDGGAKGIVIYERLLKQMKGIDFKGLAFFEIGIEQGDLIKPIIKKYFPKAKVEVKDDMAGIDRIVIIKM